MRRRHKQGPLSTDRMRSMWEFVFVSQFLRVFHGKFGFVSFTAEELENAFLEATNPALFGIFAKLLRVLFPKRDVKATTWQEMFKDELEKRSAEWNPFNGGKRYDDLSAENRVLLLKHLIEFVAEDKDKEMKKFCDAFLDPNSSGTKPVGHDADNNIYWYFDDLRLYREAAGKTGSPSGWETVCVNCSDWERLLRTFQKSSNSDEKKLYKYLKDELYPAVMPIVKENEKEKELETMKKKRFPMAQQKESSRRRKERNEVVREEDQGLERSKRDQKLEEEEQGDEEEEESEEAEEDEDKADEQEPVEEVEEEGEDSSEEEEEEEGEEEMSSNPVAEQPKTAHWPPEQEPRKRGRPAGTRTSNMDHSSAAKNEMRWQRSRHEQEQMQKEIQERKELERRVEEEIKKQESMINATGIDSRTKRRCVIMREQLSQTKKEWWEEEGLGSDSENEDEWDIDSDSSDRPRRRKKARLPKPIEMPEPPNRIYVFSTGLANRASEAVQQGKFESISAYHKAQPSSSPFLQVERTNSMNYFGKQRPYYSQRYPAPGGPVSSVGQMTGFSGMSSGMHRADRQPGSRPGYGTSQWDAFQTQQQQLYKDRQRQTQTQAMDDIHQLLFGSSHGGNAQGPVGVNGMYSRGGYNQRGGTRELSSRYSDYPPHGTQHQASFMERHMQESRGQAQHAKFPIFSQQQQQQQQQQQHQPHGYFQSPRHLAGLQPQGNSHSPSSDPLGAGVRSPPPPYPGGRPADSRHPRNSPVPVPSPTSTGSPHTPQTPLTPQTPRFPGPSPTEPTKPPFSPSHPQASICGPTVSSFPSQAPSAVQSGSDDRPLGSQPPRPGYIELSSKSLQRGMQNQFPSVMGNYNPVQSPLDGRRPEDNKSPVFGSPSNHESPLHSPTDAPQYSSGPPNKSPFLRQGVQPPLNHNPFATSASVIAGSKSFSVESLTAPSHSLLEKSSVPLSQLSEQPIPQYSSLYFPSNKYSPMFGQPQYQYPSHIQHPGAFYNSQLTPNMYLGRASLPVYPPNRDSGL